MGIFTELKPTEIRALIKLFPELPAGACESRGIALGTVNTYYKLTFPNCDAYYLKIDEVADEKRLKNEILIFENLHRHRTHLSHATPYPLTANSGKKYVPFRNKFALILPELQGKSYYGRDLTPSRLARIGQAMAEWHSLPADPRIREHRFNLAGQRKVYQEIRQALEQRHPDLNRFIRGKLRWLTRRQPKLAKLPLIHADLFPENILWVGNRIHGILDFDATGRGSPLFDIGVCVHALCHDGTSFQPQKIEGFLKGYFARKRPTASQRRQFHYYLDETAMRFLLTRLRDFELVPAARKVEPFKDYKDFERRFGENAALALEF